MRGRPLAEVIAARALPQRLLRISMAAGGLPVSGHFRWTTPTPPCARCRRACPSISAATPLVRVDQRRDLNRHLLATCCPAGPSRCILATAFYPHFYLSRRHPDFPAAATSGTRPGHPRNFPRGSRPEPPPWRSRPTIGRHRLDGTLSLQSPGTCYNVRLCRIQLTRVDQRRDLNRHLLATCCQRDRLVVYSPQHFTRIFYLSRRHPDFPAAATSGTADPDIPGTFHGDRDRNRRPGAPARPSGVIG